MTDELRFDGRVAVVTGAGRGLGRAYALLLASRGAHVLVNDLGTDASGRGSDAGIAQTVVTEVEDAGGSAAGSVASVATVEGARSIIDDALSRWGRIDVLINNAGPGSAPSTIDQVDEAELRRMFEIHVYGAFFTIGAAWPHLVDQGYGRILNTSSSGAFGLTGEYAYTGAKAALLGLTKALAVDGAAQGIKVNAVLPIAYTRLAQLVPDEAVREWMRSTFTPEQVAAVAVALVHENVPFTGEAISTGGGRVARAFFGVVPGTWDAAITPESVLENIDDSMSMNEFTMLNSTMDEAVYLAPPDSALPGARWTAED
jgi:NAD(P)-dependent dehydrogenase (short-subunit alcohol dehydrogenase family)